MSSVEEQFDSRESKHEKRARKERKRQEKAKLAAEDVTGQADTEPHSSKKSKRHTASNSSDDIQSKDPSSEGEVDPKKRSESKKRKRDSEVADELEINLSLPEPPSKKALRRAKKGKPVADTVSEKHESKGEDDAELGKATREAEKPAKRSEFGIWIGNLPWSATKDGLRLFFTANSDIKDSSITRIHMPKPKPSANTNLRIKPNNMGFAYVDFDTSSTLSIAMGLSELQIDGRNVLIKNAKSFEGRPEKPKPSAGGPEKPTKPPNKRIFVGNLSFDVTKDDLFKHFEPCGQVDDVFLATFEDTGKCKGYGWVTFAEIPAAGAAVRGFTFKEVEPVQEEGDEETAGAAKKTKPRKWFVNKIQGRPLRCEFAEDPSMRYKKRFGKEKPDEQE